MASQETDQAIQEPDKPADSQFEGTPFRETTDPITIRAILTNIFGGVLGIIAMLPVAVGLPAVLGLFELSAPAGFAFLVGAQPSATLGVAFFLLGGAVVLPLFFSVTATYLPPADPPFVRGVTMATIFWPGFVIGFWPAGGMVTNLTFLAVSIIAHWVYGVTLGLFVDRYLGIPEHDL